MYFRPNQKQNIQVSEICDLMNQMFSAIVVRTPNQKNDCSTEHLLF